MSDGHIDTDRKLDTHTAVCDLCGFTSTNWPTKTSAGHRLDQHLAEHDTGEPMPELAESGIKGAVGRD